MDNLSWNVTCINIIIKHDWCILANHYKMYDEKRIYMLFIKGLWLYKEINSRLI
jgi:hypothetical protein